MKRPRKRGRPPAGERPGERVTDYPQLSVRVPHSTLQQLRAISTVSRSSQSKVLTEAVLRYLDSLPEDQRRLIDGLLARANDVFEQPSRRSISRPAKPITILNVDDHEAALFARSTILRREGWRVIEAQTGRAALDAVQHHHPDVVVLDVHLPDINGPEVCRRIKSDPATADVRVVQVSASVHAPLDQLYCLEQGGADMYLSEPIARGTLLSVIERLVSRGSAA